MSGRHALKGVPYITVRLKADTTYETKDRASVRLQADCDGRNGKVVRSVRLQADRDSRARS